MVKTSFVRNGLWSDEDDAKILTPASKHCPRNSVSTPKKTGLRRCGKSCRLRWTDYSASTALKHDSFTPEDEDLIIKMHAAMGSRWSLIAQQLQGKTENDVKIFWNSKLKKKLSEMGIDPVTHRPFSHILADYGNINGGTLNRNGSLNRSLKNPFSVAKSPSFTDPNQASESGDLLSHLEAIKFMTETASTQIKPNTFLPGFCNGQASLTPSSALSDSSSSSSSSSSSTSSAAPQENTELNFIWSDFLLDQEIIFQDTHQKPEELEDSYADFSEAVTVTTSAMVSSSGNNITTQENGENPSNGFVESIIAKEKEMHLGFSGYLEQPFYE